MFKPAYLLSECLRMDVLVQCKDFFKLDIIAVILFIVSVFPIEKGKLFIILVFLDQLVIINLRQIEFLD